MFTEECEEMTVNIYYSNFTRNFGSEAGGAIATFFKNTKILVFLYKCIIEENESVIGGGLSLWHQIGNMTAVECTF